MFFGSNQITGAHNLGRRLFKSRGVVLPWWNIDGATPGGVGGSCVGAYQAKSSASYAVSKVNLANPGTNDLVEGNGAVPWAGATGWGFVAASLQWLDVGTGPGPQGAPNQSWTAIIQFANFASNGDLDIMQTRNNNMAGFGFKPNRFGSVRYLNGSNLLIAPSLLTGNLCVSGNTAYRNGIAEVGAIPLVAYFGDNVFIGAANNAGVGIKFVDSDIWAVALYSAILTAPQVLARAVAMAAL